MSGVGCPPTSNYFLFFSLFKPTISPLYKRRASLCSQQSAQGALPWGYNYQVTEQRVILQFPRVTGVEEMKRDSDWEASPLTRGKSCHFLAWSRCGGGHLLLLAQEDKPGTLPSHVIQSNFWQALSSLKRVDSLALVPSLNYVAQCLKHLTT